ncbi:hypothetical protein [Belnapia rosea]|uniref:Uncharacterized protein n=1 Tax=Belnapia rosea TaxID=938405 RepID=A0A1G6QVV1_9PROT|nr:hypothetical protein [Belnapia rosea]SDC95915.1 hypothetical protein SAMN04487779_1003187 [Belnapia rosea]
MADNQKGAPVLGALARYSQSGSAKAGQVPLNRAAGGMVTPRPPGSSGQSLGTVRVVA